MLYNTGKEWCEAKYRRISLFGMSGVGKTWLSNILRESGLWFHFSVDYRIATKYLGEDIVDDYKKEAMKSPLLRKHLLNDSMYISSNVSFNNISPLSSYLGKPGSTEKGGMAFDEYLKRQRKHRDAEIKATIDAEIFSEKSSVIYGYNHFVTDTSGSLCEVVRPEKATDPVLSSLAKTSILIWVKGSDKVISELRNRFKKSPKPMYYNEEFLQKKWKEYCINKKKIKRDIDPDEFALHGFDELITHRLPIYEAIAKNWGITIDSEQIQKIENQEQFVEIVAEAIDRKYETAGS